MEGSTNIGLLFFSWWYKEAYGRLLSFLKHFFAYLFDLFSVRLCFKTFFAPWKRDKISSEGLSLQQQFQVWTLNLSSRFIGSFIKLFTVITFLLAASVFALLSFIMIIVWFVYPVCLIALLIIGFKYLFGV
ncbi:MAG: hypothetical protein WC536_00930 [Patescibacteria group bacterium]